MPAPGKGIAPLRRIVDMLKRKKCAGPAPVGMFDAAIQSMDPYEFAKKARDDRAADGFTFRR